MASTNARLLRTNPTEAEKRLWTVLRRQQVAGHRFRRQAPIGRYIVDFVCLRRRLVIEIDGGQHADRVQADAARSAWLESQGFRVLRFWNNDVLGNTNGVVEAIRQALREPSNPRQRANNRIDND